ncbi:MAG TPA: o-succinylbenzoate synthase [Acidimicrobiia bacterium]|nr:o-succinylbenzoate synthase [Acidimicrobiia bacterium]
MRVREIELRWVRMPLVRPFRTAHGVEHERDVLVLRIATDSADGWSECVAPNAPTYTSEWVGGAHAVIREFLGPMLLAAPVRPSDVAGRLAGIEGHAMAKAALETAVLDAQLRTEGRSLASFLGATRTRVECGVAVGMADSIAALIDECAGYLAAGYRRVKLKIEPGWDVEPVAEFRKQFGPVPLQVDANGAYGLGDAPHLAQLDDFDLLCIEQPLAANDLPAHAGLARLIRTPICLDESITSARVAREAIDAGSCAVVCVKPGRVGGYLESLAILDVCASRGVRAWCGGMLETGLGRAANLALAAHPGFTMIGDVSASDRYFARDLTAPFVLESGELPVPDGPGIGVVPDPDSLRALTTSIEVVSRSIA